MLPHQARVDLGVKGNEGVLCIPQNSRIAGTSPSDCLVSYSGHLLEGVHLVYSTDWAKMKNSEKINEYLNLARKLKKPWDMKMMMIPIKARVLGTVHKGLGNKLEEMV